MASSVVSVLDQQLDNSITFVADGFEHFASDNGVYKSRFYQKGNRVQYESKGHVLTWTPKDIKYFDEFGIEDVIYDVQDAPLETKGFYARFNRTFPDIDDLFIVENERLKHNIVIQGFQRDPFEYLFGNIEFVISGTIEFAKELNVFALASQGDASNFETDGAIQFVDPTGQVVYTMPKVIAYDSRAENRGCATGRYRASVSAPGVLDFSIVLDNDWISSLDRVYPVVIDPTVIVASAYDISGNGGRKLVRLSNGWIVAASSTTGTIYLHISKDNGTTWATQTNSVIGTGGTTIQGLAIASKDNNVYVLAALSSNNAVFYKHDAVANSISYKDVDTGQTAVSGASLTIDSIGALHAAWSSKNGTYPNSLNIRYSKSTDGGGTWANPTQITTINADGTQFASNPCIIVLNNNNPVITYQAADAGGKSIGKAVYNGISWTTGPVYLGGTYDQFSACAIVKKYGSNMGRICSVWHAYDSTDTTKYNVRVSYSDDNGATWSAPVKITTGNTIDRQKPVLAENTNGDVYVFYQDGAAISYQKCTNGTTAFSGVTSFATSGSNPAAMTEAVNSMIGVIFMDASAVKFEKILFNQPPLAPTLTPEPSFDATTAQTFNWTFNDPDTGNTQSAYQLLIKRVSDGVTVHDSGKVASTTASRTLAANTLVNGVQYQWQVRTWDNSDAQGPNSSLGTFSTSGQPTAAITEPAADGATIATSGITAAWSFSDPESKGQGAYQLKLTSNADVVLWDSLKTSDVNARSRTANYVLVNSTSYKLKLTVWDADDIPSTEVVRTINVSFTPPPTPTIAVTGDSANARNTVTITNPAPSGTEPVVSGNDVYRRRVGEVSFVRIAANVLGSYQDYTVESGVTYEYMVRAIGNNGTTADSATESAGISFVGVWLHNVADPTATIQSFIDAPGRSAIRKSEGGLMKYDGRVLPTAEFGQMVEAGVDVQLQLDRQDPSYLSLQSLIQSKTTLCYRDGRGRKLFGVVFELTEDEEQWGYIIPIRVDAIDYEEAI